MGWGENEEESRKMCSKERKGRKKGEARRCEMGKKENGKKVGDYVVR